MLVGEYISDEQLCSLLMNKDDKYFFYKFVDLLFHCEVERDYLHFLQTQCSSI